MHHSAQATSSLNANGSAEFAGPIKTGVGPKSVGASGAEVSSTGLIASSRTSGKSSTIIRYCFTFKLPTMKSQLLKKKSLKCSLTAALLSDQGNIHAECEWNCRLFKNEVSVDRPVDGK